MTNDQNNYFILIDSSEIKQGAIEKLDEWLETIGDILKKIAGNELRAIQKET